MSTATSHLDHVLPDRRIGLPGEMRRKINVTMIGAGSFFTNSILKDVILIPGNQGGELRLVDIDGGRLKLTRRLIQKIVDDLGDGSKWTIKASLDRAELLPGTDYIVNAIEVSG